MGTHQQRLKLIRLSTLDLEQFVAEEAERIHLLWKTLALATSKRTKFATVKRRTAREHLARIQPKYNHQVTKERRPSLKKQQIPVNAALPQRGPPVISMEERLWLPLQTSQKYDHSLKPLSFSRTGWSCILAQRDESNL